MKRLRILVMVMATLFGTATLARGEQILAVLTGLEEVPVVSTAAAGTFYAFTSGDSISYSLFYIQLQGTVTQAHIHAAQPGVNGGIIIWLCQTATNVDPTGLSPQCPQTGNVTGTITAANVIATAPPPPQAASSSALVTLPRPSAPCGPEPLTLTYTRTCLRAARYVARSRSSNRIFVARQARQLGRDSSSEPRPECVPLER